MRHSSAQHYRVPDSGRFSRFIARRAGARFRMHLMPVLCVLLCGNGAIGEGLRQSGSRVTEEGEREYYLREGTNLSRFFGGPRRYLCRPFFGTAAELMDANVRRRRWDSEGCRPNREFLARPREEPEENPCTCEGEKLDIESIDLTNGRLWKACLCEADLSKAELAGANLSWSDLSGADLQDADLHGARLWDVRFTSADLRNANLRDATLCHAHMHGADMSGADLSGADLKGVHGITAEQLCSCRGLRDAKLPWRLRRLVKRNCPEKLER